MGGESGTGDFGDALCALKRRGSGLLVVGETGDGTHLALSRRLLGRDDGQCRRRVVVLTDSPATAGRRIPDAAPPDTYRVIDHRPQTRSAAASTGGAPPPSDLDRLEAEIVDAIEALGPPESVEPAELRVCVDSLRPLVTDGGVQAVVTFLDTVLTAVRDRRGMAHAHLPVAYDAPLVGVFAPSFDAVIQLRPGEHRWHLTREDRATKWLPV